MATTSARPLRADARRNREAILTAARETFEREGIFASIDGIAVVAGVGNATLYRNFPTRDDLLAAVIEDSISALLQESTEFDLSPDESLREWLFRLAWQLRIWHDLPTCVASARNDPDSPVQDVPTRLTVRTGQFLQVAIAEGTAQAAVSAEELFELALSMSWGIDRFGDDADRARARMRRVTAGIFGVD